MIYLVHGDDYAKSRKLAINQFKNSDTSLKHELKISELTPDKLLDLGSSFDLFSQPPFLFIILDEITKDEKYINILKSLPKETDVIFLAEKSLGVSDIFLKNAKALNIKVLENSIEVNSNIFKFMDCLFSLNRKGAYNEYKYLLEEQDNGYIFNMMLYGLRNVMLAKYKSPNFLAKKSYMVTKAVSQASKFSEEQVQALVAFFYDLEKKLKIGMISYEMSVSIGIEKILAQNEKNISEK